MKTDSRVLKKIGCMQLITYKRIGRVYSLEVLKKIMEELKGYHKSKGEN
ncbi:MAG: hypothetical protein QXI93_01820 [Candidatus Methanomethylicia archaeon]